MGTRKQFPLFRSVVYLSILLSVAVPTHLVHAANKKKASALMSRQTPPKIHARTMKKLNADTNWVRVSLSAQRAYLMTGDKVAIDTPISTGMRSRPTPTGTFKVLEKDKDHRSSIYGKFVDSRGRTVRSGVSTRIHSAPSGTHYVGAPMWNFMRVTWQGVGMHVGNLPGYPASHGCIRMPKDIAPLFYKNVKLGTKVIIE